MEPGDDAANLNLGEGNDSVPLVNPSQYVNERFPDGACLVYGSNARVWANVSLFLFFFFGWSPVVVFEPAAFGLCMWDR